MLSPYNISAAADKKSYQFETSSGDLYFAYFTEFSLTKRDGSDLIIFCFGFNCRKADTLLLDKIKYDPRIELTILFLINRFFEENGEHAILYLCLNNDGKAKYRHRTFNRWFNKLNESLIKHQIILPDFYSSIVLLKSNPLKDEIINTFEHTVRIYSEL